MLLRDSLSAARDVMGGMGAGVQPGKYYKGYDRAKDAVYANLTANGMRIVSVTKTAGSDLTVYWLDGALWFTAMDG